MIVKKNETVQLIVCDVCGDQREIEYALTHGTHRALGGDSVRHYCVSCADDVAVTCA